MAGAGTTPRMSGPVLLDAGTNDVIRASVGAGPATSVLVAAGVDKTGFWRGDAGAGDTAALVDLAQAIQSALIVALGAGWTVAISNAGVLTIHGPAAWTLLLADALFTFPPAYLGHVAGVDIASGAGDNVISPGQITPCFYPESIYVRDSEPRDEIPGALTEGGTGRFRWQEYPGRIRRQILQDALLSRKIFQAEEVRVGESYERFWRATRISRFEWTRDLASLPAGAAAWAACTYVLASKEQRQALPITLTPNTARRYDIDLRLALYVA